MSIEHSVLLLSLPTAKHIRSPSFLSEAIAGAVAQTQKSLLVIVFSPLFSLDTNQNESIANAPVHFWKTVQSFLTFIYVEAVGEAHSADNILLSVDVVLLDSGPISLSGGALKKYHPEKWEAVFALDSGLDEIIPFDELPISHLPSTIFPTTFVIPRPGDITPSSEIASQMANMKITEDASSSKLPPSYPVTALGGTFDHLHAGHKILLSMAAWIAKDKLIVGVTDEALLQKKSNAQVLESLDTRMARVREFCQRFKPSLEYDIVPLSDVYGPTAWDPNIQALVLSDETREGATAVAKLRAERHLPPLEPFVIDVISSSSVRLDPEDAAALRSGKLSSTAIRQWIVDREEQASKPAIDGPRSVEQQKN